MPIEIQGTHGANDEYGGMAHDERMDRMSMDRSIFEATVVRTIPGSYTVVVEYPGSGECAAIYCPGMVSGIFGVSECELPSEGSKVLVYDPGDISLVYVLGVLPALGQGFGRDDDSARYKYTSQEIDQEPGSDYLSTGAHEEVNRDPNTLDHIDTESGRPWNVLAGEWVRGNKMGVAVAIKHFYALLQAGDRAKLEMSVFDDLVRLTSGTFEHQSAMGIHRSFDDQGELMTEIAGSKYSYERLGEDEFGEVLSLDEGQGSENSVPVGRPDVTPKDRYRIFLGALADIFQIYTRDPEGLDTEDRTGDFRAAVEHDGRFSLASRKGISIGLRSRIPVPTRSLEPWDPEGDGGIVGTNKENYEFSQEYPYGRNLEMADALAWREHLIYQRFDEKSKDFTVPEHGETQLPDGQSEGKNCGIDWGDDGSVRIWGGNGEEIFMRGGCIIFSAPGTIEEHIGGSKVVLAGQDIVQKARGSVDILAENRDVRIKANGNMHLHTVVRGMMITTDSAASVSVDGSNQGEEVESSGILIGGKDADVALVGDNLSLVANDNVRIKGDGVQVSSTEEFNVVGKYVFMEAAGQSALKLSSTSCTLLGGAVSVAASRSATLQQGSESAVIEWQNVGGQSAYDAELPQIQSVHGDFYVSEAWLGELTVDNRQNVRFTYRTSEQCGTDKPSETDGRSGVFSVYQPAWQLGLEGDSWEEKQIEGTYPWPGADARSSAFVTYEEGDNVDDGDPANRSDMGPSGGTFRRTTMDEYKIR